MVSSFIRDIAWKSIFILFEIFFFWLWEYSISGMSMFGTTPDNPIGHRPLITVLKLIQSKIKMNVIVGACDILRPSR